MSGNLNQETNKLKDEVNKRELHFLRTGDPRPEPQVDKVANKLEENQGILLAATLGAMSNC